MHHGKELIIYMNKTMMIYDINLDLIVQPIVVI